MATQTKYINKLQSKRVLVFGGTAGIGLCIAEAAIEHGATVIISSSTQTKVDSALQSLRTSYPNANVSGYICDLSNPSTLLNDVESILKKVTNGGVDKLDHIAFTAGDYPKSMNFDDPEVFQSLNVVRIMAPSFISKFLPVYMNVSSESSFTLTSGAAGLKPRKGMGRIVWAAGAIESLSRGLAVELQPIRVNTVVPGVIATDRLAALPQDVQDRFKEDILWKQFGRPEDTAEAYIYLMKDGFATGSLVHTNGGALLT